MIIRCVDHKTLDKTLEITKRMHAAGRFKDLDYNDEKCRALICHCIDNPGSYFFYVAEMNDGRIAGFHMGNVQEYFFSKEKMAQSISFYVAPEYRGSSAAVKLLIAFKKWAIKRGAVEMVFGSGLSEGAPLAVVDTFLKRMGLELTGGNYGEWLSPVGVRS